MTGAINLAVARGRIVPALLAVAAGLLLGLAAPTAGLVGGPAFAVAAFLALFTGLAKTSSA